MQFYGQSAVCGGGDGRKDAGSYALTPVSTSEPYVTEEAERAHIQKLAYTTPQTKGAYPCMASLDRPFGM